MPPRPPNGFRAGQIFGKGGQAQMILSKSLGTLGNIFTKGTNIGKTALDVANKTGLIAEASAIPDIGPAIAQGAAAAPAILDATGTAGNLLTRGGNALR